MQPFGTKKKQATPWDQKITQPLRTKKNHATTWDKKKITQPLGTKKIKHYFRTKKSCNLSGQENHATSQDKKISCNLSGQKNHATSWDKNITLPLRTKIITQPIGTKKSCNLSGQKITQHLCPNGSK